MSVAGPTIAGTGADGGGVTPWTNPGSITANDGTFATCALNLNISNELLAKNFGFAIPGNAVVTNVQVDVFRKRV